MKALAYLNKYLRKYWGRLCLGLLFTVASILFKIIPARYVRNAFDLVSAGLEDDGVDFDVTILKYAAIILGAALAGGFFLFLIRQTIIVVSRLIEYDLKNEIYQHYQTLDSTFYKQNNTGDLMARISEDVSRVRMYLGPAIMYGINLVTTFVLVIGYMFTINVKLTLFAIAPLPFLSIVIYYVNNIINRKSEVIQAELSNMSSFTQETFSGINILKSFVREKQFGQRFSDISNSYKDKSLDLVKTQAWFFSVDAYFDWLEYYFDSLRWRVGSYGGEYHDGQHHRVSNLYQYADLAGDGVGVDNEYYATGGGVAKTD